MFSNEHSKKEKKRTKHDLQQMKFRHETFFYTVRFPTNSYQILIYQKVICKLKFKTITEHYKFNQFKARQISCCSIIVI